MIEVTIRSVSGLNVFGPCRMESEASVLDLKRRVSFEPLAIEKRIKLVKYDREHGELNNDDKLIHHSENEQLQATLVVNSCGSLVTWGHEDLGGDSLSVADELKSGVTAVFNTLGDFAALKEGGKVVTWGGRDSDGDSWGHAGSGGDSLSVADELKNGVTNVFSTRHAFAALKDCWSDGHLSQLNLKQLKEKVDRLSQDGHCKRIGQNTDKATWIAAIREFHLLA